MNKKWLLWASAGLFFLLAVSHIAIVAYLWVDVPYWDEWALFKPHKLPSGFSLSYLFEFHNEHRNVPSNLIAWINFALFGYNTNLQVAINMALWGTVVWFFFYLRKVRFPEVSLATFFLFACFLTTPVIGENIHWGFQTAFHLVLFFFMLSAHVLFQPDQSWKRVLTGTGIGIVAIYTLSGGIPLMAGVLGVYTLFKITQRTDKKKHLAQLLVCLSLTGVSIALWSIGYNPPASHPDLLFPNHAAFWNFWLETISHGFGFQSRALGIGLLCLCAVSFPLIRSLPQWNKDIGLPFLCALAAGIFLFLAAISMGRAGAWPDSSKLSRYCEVALPLIPIALFAWWRVGPKKWTPWLIFFLWLIPTKGYWNRWNWSIYHQVNKVKLEARECLKEYYDGQGPPLCKGVYPFEIREELEAAKRINASFYRSLQK